MFVSFFNCACILTKIILLELIAAKAENNVLMKLRIKTCELIEQKLSIYLLFILLSS